MDSLFVANVPDLSQWSTLHTRRYNHPRPYLCRTLEFTIQEGSPRYMDNVHEMARSIASARLDSHYLHLWNRAVRRLARLTSTDRIVIARALARGICRSGSDWRRGVPQCNDDHFKGHIVEMLLFCLRVYLMRNGGAHPCLFEPPRPKASSATGGIDLLELGKTRDGYYFQVWECKGTDGGVSGALVTAANQLCASDSTAYQSFMEAHRSLQVNYLSNALANFVREMPRRFYESPPHRSKRLGGAVATGSNYMASDTQSFARTVDGLVTNGHVHCHVVIVKIANFPRFREDVYQHLWNIY